MDVIFWNGGIKWDLMVRYIGPYKIAHWIRKFGYTGQVIDFVDNLTKDQLTAATKKFITEDTAVLAISTTFLCNNTYTWEDGTFARLPEYVVQVMRELKAEHPRLKIVIGGYMADKLGGWGVADASIMSYTSATEDIFLEYLNHLKRGDPKPINTLILSSFGKKLPKPRPWFNAARNPQYNIENDDFRFIEADCILPGEPLPLDVSRGCIFACRFCQYPHIGKKKLDYIRGMKYIEDELRYNYDTFGTTRYYILDDTFNDTEYKMAEFYKMTQRLPFKINYFAYLRADLIHRFPKMAYYLQESGLWGAFHGLETLNQYGSKLIGKAWSGKHAKEYIPELFHNVWGKKIPMHNNFIIGIAGDSEQGVKDTIKWHIDNDMHSMNFDVLGLFGPDNATNRYTILSEFDKNAAKYGYKFNDIPDPRGYTSWTTDNWTTESALALANEIEKDVYNANKMHAWAAPTMLWYGMSKDYILETPIKNMQLSHAKELTSLKYTQYYNMILES